MKAIILAAGYGTRLQKEFDGLKQGDKERYNRLKPSFMFSLGDGKQELRAKPMVLLAGKPLVQHIAENIERAGVSGIYLVTNNRFFNQFSYWSNNYSSKVPLEVINDGTNCNEKRLGAVKDLQLVLNQADIDEPTMLIAGDNLLTFELSELVDFYNEKQTSIAVAYPEKDLARLQRSACVDFNEQCLLTYFEEYPPNPKTNLMCPSIYVYHPDLIRVMRKRKISKGEKDQIGNVVGINYENPETRFHVFAKPKPIRLDLGTVANFEEAEKITENNKK